MKYIGKTGRNVGREDDAIGIVAASVEEAMRKLLGYSVDQWPESDSPYSAVCWIEDEKGNVLLTEDVEIMADGRRSL